MGKKKSKAKIDSAYYFIGAIVIAIAGYYYYIHHYKNGINLEIYGYVIIDASKNIQPTEVSEC